MLRKLAVNKMGIQQALSRNGNVRAHGSATSGIETKMGPKDPRFNKSKLDADQMESLERREMEDDQTPMLWNPKPMQQSSITP